MSTRTFITLLLALCCACGSKSSSGGSGGTCSGGRSCALACKASADCDAPTGEVCSGGYCGQAAPTSTAYVQCALDADCARGDYCGLSACQHDCLTDRDCSGGTVCSDRGRCVATASVGQPAPVTAPSPGKPAVAPAALDFGSAATTLTFTLTNGGTDPFDYRLLSSRSWLSAAPFQGQLAGGKSVAITVSLDRAAAAKDSGGGGFLAVNTSAGYLRVAAAMAADLGGAWSGALHVTGPVDLGNQALVVDVQESGGSLYGFVDADQSPLYPLRAAVNGSRYVGAGGAEVVSFGFDLPGPAGDLDLNPAYPKDILRHFTFTGTRTDSTTLTGTFTESVDGLLTGVQTQLTGDAVFTRSGAMSSGVPDPAPRVTIVRTVNPFGTAGALTAPYAGCTTCAGGACSPSPSVNAGSFLYATDGGGKPLLAFYDAFWQAWHSSGAGNPFQSIDACAATGACAAPFDDQALRCAQYWAWAGLGSAPDLNGRTLLDTLEPATDYALFLGNAATASAFDGWYDPSGSLDQQVAVLAGAEQSFTSGLHSSDQSAPRALLDPFYTDVLASLPKEAVAGPAASLLSGSPIHDDGSYRTEGEHVRRALRAIESGLFAASRRAQLQRRQQKDADAATSVRRAAVRSWLDLAALAPALGKSPATWANDAAPLRDALADAARRYIEVAQGRDLLGYAPSYVPFLFHYSGTDSGSNYGQIKAMADSSQALWASVYGAAAESRRTFESSAATLRTELSNQLSTIDLQLQDLCGAKVTDASQCGAGGTGQVGAQVLEIQAAILRISNVRQQMANVLSAVQYEESRAAQVAQLHQNQAVLILQTGERVYADDKAIRVIDAAEKMAHGLLGGALGSVLNPYAFVAGVGDAIITGVAAAGREGYEQDKAEALSAEQAQVEYNAAQTELIDSAARVKTDLLQLSTLRIDLDIAAVNLEQAHGQLKSLFARTSALLSDRTRVAAIYGANTGYALNYRVYADHLIRQEAVAMDRALDWGFLAARALGYQLVRDVPLPALWNVRTPTDLAMFLATLADASQKAPSSQSNIDVISLRDRILGLGDTVKDAVTGAEVAPRERFRRYVADPAHRDASGNLHLYFSTAGLDRQVFSTAVCSDRIQTIAVNLVGDSLGANVRSAYVKLEHGGTTYLRSCSRTADGSTPLLAYDMTAKGNGPSTARVHAAINHMTDGQAQLPVDYELADRAVLADTWELVIEAGDNAGLNVLGLDDIELTFIHDAYTIQ